MSIYNYELTWKIIGWWEDLKYHVHRFFSPKPEQPCCTLDDLAEELVEFPDYDLVVEKVAKPKKKKSVKKVAEKKPRAKKAKKSVSKDSEDTW